jgi:DNA polymerase elongation subunit (family B)
MIAEINSILTGKYDHEGESIIYGDTDSCYFTAETIVPGNPEFGDFEWNKNNIVQLYDAVGEQTNGTFTNFMKATFNTPEERGSVIRAGRELIGSKGIFIKKKRYAILVFDMEGDRLDLLDQNAATKKKVEFGFGKIKAMGLDTKRTDTPKPIQDFLQEILMRILKGGSEEEVLEFIKNFREEFKTWPPYFKGRPSSVNKLTFYTDLAKKGKATIPGHVRAAINWNKLRQAYCDNYSMEIQDGYKVIVCKLKDNPMKFSSIAYPVDETHLPTWFKELPFDEAGMEDKIIDQKIENLIGVLKWDVESTREDNNFTSLFVKKKK